MTGTAARVWAALQRTRHLTPTAASRQLAQAPALLTAPAVASPLTLTQLPAGALRQLMQQRCCTGRGAALAAAADLRLEALRPALAAPALDRSRVGTALALALPRVVLAAQLQAQGILPTGFLLMELLQRRTAASAYGRRSATP